MDSESKMNIRPKPGEEEDDLLKMQQMFLNSESKGALSVTIKRPDKRRSAGPLSEQRDVVKLEGFQAGDSVVPTKKSKFKAEQQLKMNEASAKAPSRTLSGVSNVDTIEEDMEEMMDKKDTGLAAVLTTIIERDTRNAMYVAPQLGRQAFPSVLSIETQHQNAGQSATVEGQSTKKSLFAQQVESQGLHKFGVDRKQRNRTGSVNEKQDEPSSTISYVSSESCVVDGRGLSASNSKSESENIHMENVNKLRSMSQVEIMEERHKLLQMMDPKIVDFLKSKRKLKESETNCNSPESTFSVQKELKKKSKDQHNHPSGDDGELPVQVKKEWLHMGIVEKDKLEWMKDLPAPAPRTSQSGSPARFDFNGNLMAVDVDVPVNMGLHHHGDEPERAGYTIVEIFQLARSSSLQQRALALHTLARIIHKAKSGKLKNLVETPIIPALLDGGVLVLLRWALDESVETVVVAAVDALHALLCSPLDEEATHLTWPWFQGHLFPSLTPIATLEKNSQPPEVDEENQEEETDADVMKGDAILALVTRMEFLIRCRYILKSMRLQAVTIVQILGILSRVAQHSTTLAYEVMKCPGLLEKIVKEFLPTAWKSSDPAQPVSWVYGLPVPSAMRLLRILCQAGRNMAMSLMSQFQIPMLILRYLAVETNDLRLPRQEALDLKVQSLALWRVAAAYGKGVDTYIDLYSDILPSVGKMQSQWLLATSSLPSSSSSGGDTSQTMSDSDHRLSSSLVCVLENMLHVAGNSRGLERQDQELEKVPGPTVDWSQVRSFYQPIRNCIISMLAEIGSSYPVKKHNLDLPISCMNFLASYYDVERMQDGVDQVASLELVEQFSQTCLSPFISSFGLRLILQSLSPYSNLLHTDFSMPSESCLNLPGLGVEVQTDCSVLSDSATESDGKERRVNLPLLWPHSPYGFLTSLLRLLLSVCKSHKGLISSLIGPVTSNNDVLVYLRKVCASRKPMLAFSHFTRPENIFQYFWLKCCNLVLCPDMSLAHRVALNLLSRIQHGDEFMAHDIISTIIFSSKFISEGEEPEMTSQALANMSLSETLYLKSATQEELIVSQGQLIRDAVSSLASMRGHFLMTFGGMEKAVADSRNVFMKNCWDISSLLVQGLGESLMPKDWIFMPLIHVYNSSSKMNSSFGSSLSPQAIAMVMSALKWSYILEVWRPEEMSQVSVTIRLSRIMCTFLAGTDLFLERGVHHYLAGLLRVFTSHKLLDKMNFEEDIPGISSFYDLYQDLVEQYEAVSFGDPVFGLYILLPLQQRHNPMLRKAVWGERRKLLRTLRLPLTEMLIPLDNYLSPDESDPELVQLYLSALLSSSVQSTWSPVMYLLAIHHVNHFLYLSQDDGNQFVRNRMWSQILSNQETTSSIIHYKHVGLESSHGMELYDSLPHNRQAILEQHKRMMDK